MKIAVHVLAYNVTRFIRSMLHNVEPHVDRIYIAYARKPFGYNQESRVVCSNPTSIEFIRAASSSPKIHIIEGDWVDEHTMRNACLCEARRDGVEWLITQDADEFYSENSWLQIMEQLRLDERSDQIVTTWYNFWKSSEYVLVNSDGSIKGTNAGFALRCRDGLMFVDRRLTNAKKSRVLDVPCYHYGYVMTDAEMYEKLMTWSHANQVNREFWYKYKWLAWSENTLNLHPVHPQFWGRAIRFPLEQPSFAHEFSLELSPALPLSKLARAIEYSNGIWLELRCIMVRVRNFLLR